MMRMRAKTRNGSAVLSVTSVLLSRVQKFSFPKKNFVPLGFEYLLDMVCRVLESTDGPQKNCKLKGGEKGDMPESAMELRV